MRRRVRKQIRPRTYCGYTDDAGYCCTSTTHPKLIWCDSHNTLINRGLLPVYDGVPALWTTDMTAEASKKALEEASKKAVGEAAKTTATAVLEAPSTLDVALAKDIVPATPPEPLATAIVKISTDNPFMFLAEHYKVDGKDWIQVASSRPANNSNQAVSKLITYINAQSGIDAAEALSATADGKELKLTLSAGVSLQDLLSEVQARQYLWDWHPYLQAIMERSGGTTEEKQSKRLDLIDAMVAVSPVGLAGRLLFDPSYDTLYKQANIRYTTAFTSKNALSICKNPDMLDKPDPKDIARDILRGKVSELTSSAETLKLPEPQWPSGANKDVEFQEMFQKVAQRIEALQTSMYCSAASAVAAASASASTGDADKGKTCSDWIEDKIKVFVETPKDLADYLDYASRNLPEFISLFKS